jgi:hypothetical protein
MARQLYEGWVEDFKEMFLVGQKVIGKNLLLRLAPEEAKDHNERISGIIAES